MLFFAFLFYFYSNLLGHCLAKYISSDSYDSLVKNSLGNKIQFCFNVIMFIYLVIVQLTLFIAISKTFYFNTENWIWNYLPDMSGHNFENFHKLACLVIALILFLIHLKRDLSAFRYLSFFSSAIFIYLVIIIIYQTFGFYDQIKDVQTFPMFKFDFLTFIK